MSGPLHDFPLSAFAPVAECYFLACTGDAVLAAESVERLMADMARLAPAFDADLLPLAWVREMVRRGRQQARRAAPLAPDEPLDEPAAWQRALRVLPAAERDALFAVGLCGLPANDAARALGALPRAVAARMAKARSNLLVLMRQRGHDVDDPVALIRGAIGAGPIPVPARPVAAPPSWVNWRLRHALLLRRSGWGLGGLLALAVIAASVQLGIGDRQDAARDLRLLASDLPPSAFAYGEETR